MSVDFEPEFLQIDDATAAELRAVKKRRRRVSRPRDKSTHPIPRVAPGQEFLRAFIPWDWLEQAASLPGAALAVGLILWQRVGVRRRQPIRFCQERSDLNLSPWATRRGIRQLEATGLIAVTRRPGHGLEVILLPVTNKN
jgi:hypothetical protein